MHSNELSQVDLFRSVWRPAKPAKNQHAHGRLPQAQRQPQEEALF